MPCHDLRPASVTFVPFKVSTAQPVGHARMLAAFVPLGLAVGGLQGASHTLITSKACSVRSRTGRESDSLWVTEDHGVGRVQASEKIYTHVGHDERSGSEPDIRPGCPVASTLAIGSSGLGETKI